MKLKFLYSWMGLSLLFLLWGNSITNASPTKDWSFAPVCTTPVISTFPSTENFDALVPNNASIFACITADNMTDCWVNDATNANMWAARSATTGSSNTGPTADNTSGSGNYVFLESSSCSGEVSYLYGPVYNVSSLSAPFMTFYYHMWGATMGTLDLEATTDGVTWTSIWSLSGDQGNAWTPASVNLSAYAGSATLAFRFVGTTGTSFTSDMAIDDITVENNTCPGPSGLTATNPTGTTADLGWTENGTATAWEIEYGPTGFTPGTGTVVAASANPYTLTGLTPSTAYDYYVRADCGANGFSSWAGPTSFTTTALCPAPTALAATNLAGTTADLGWTESGSATAWEVEYGLTGFTQGTGTVVAASANPYTVTGLTPSTAYDYYVRADCGANGFSTWTGPTSFTTTVLCPAPTALEAINVLDTQAALSWTPGGTETMWSVEYGPSGFTPGTGTVATTTTIPFPVTGLTPSTGYDFYVTADCGAGGTSTQAGPALFVTQCPPTTAPYCQDFENAGTVPMCWRNFGPTDAWKFSIGPISGGHVGAGGNLADHTSGTGYFAWVDDSSPHGLRTSLQSPLVDVSGLTSPELSFWVASDNEGNTNVDFSLDIWDGAAWNMAVYTSNTNTSGWLEVIIDLTTLNITGPVMAVFVVDENNGTDFYDDLAIDDVCFREKPSCPAVANLTIDDVLDTQAELGWTAGGTETQWMIEYGPTGFTPGTGTVVTTTTNPHVLTGLMGSTAYDYYVTSDCGAGGMGMQVGPVTFVTQCLATPAPYCQDFENGGNTPACWRNFGSESWNFDIGPFTGHTGNAGDLADHTSGTGYFAWVDDSSPQSTGTTLQSPLVNVSGLTAPEISFWVASNNEGFTNVDFSVNLWDGAAWNNAIYTSNTNTGGWLEVILPLSAYTITGPIMVTFVVDENNGTDFYDDIAIDDFCVRNTPVCPAPAALTAANITKTSADLSWASAGTAFNLEYGPCGFTKGTGTTASSTTTNYAVSGLNPGTCYEYYVENDCGGPVSNLVISGIGDGPLSGGQPKFVELYAAGPIADLGIYGLESVNNGGGSNMPEYTFPAGVALAQGSFIYITGDSAAFNMFFGFDADYIDAASTSINGDDAVALYESGAIIDMAGDPNMDGTGTPWEYLDGWMYRIVGNSNSATFNVSDWAYSGINVFDGQTTNATSPTPFPLGTYEAPVSVCAGPYAFTTLVGCGGPFYDDGGAASVYSNGLMDTITICPDIPGDIVTVTFTQFDVEPRTDSTCWDSFFIYDGGNTSAPVIPSTAGPSGWCWDALATAPPFGTGNLTGMSITSSDASGCLTFIFASDASVAFDGWAADVTCAPPPCPDPSALGATNITHNSADLTWTSSGTAHTVEYDLTGFTPGTGTTVATAASPYTLGGLAPNTTYDYYLKNNCGSPTSDLQMVGVLDGDLPNNLHAVVLYANENIADLSIYSIKQTTNGSGTVTYSTTLPAVPLAEGAHYYIGRQPSSFAAFFGFQPDHAASISLNGDDAVGLYENNVLIDIYGDYSVDGTGTAWDYTSGWAMRNNNTPNNGGVFDLGNWNINNQVFSTAAPNASQSLPFPVNGFSGSTGLGLSECIGPFTFTTLCSPIAISADSVVNVACNGGANGAIFITPANGVTPYTFAWSNGNATEDIGGLVPGSYVVTIVDAAGCSFVSTPYTITEPTALAVSVDGFTNASCNGGADGSISISMTGGTPPYSYNWSNGATSEDLTGLSAGAYTGTITDGNGCTLVAGPVNITEPAMPISFTLDAMTNVSCNGLADGEILITTTGGTPPYTYLWSTGDATEDITGLAAGTYEGTITDANGCTLASGPVSITEPAPILLSATHVDATPTGGGTDGSIDLMVSGGTTPYTYLWNTGATTEDLTGISLGAYDVTVTDANGCVETYGQAVGNTAVVDIDELEKFELFPNPTNGQTQVVLEFEKPVDLNIRIVNVLGQVIFEQSDNQVKSNQYTVDMARAAAGTYFVHLQVEGAVKTKQLIVTH